MTAWRGGSPFSLEDPHFHNENGDPGSPLSQENGDTGPHFTGKMGTRGPHFRGSPFYLDSGTCIAWAPGTIIQLIF